MAAKFKDIGQNVSNRLKNLTTLIFDMDNTLIPTRRADLKICNKIAEALHADHDMPQTMANSATLAYLKLFRRCPENPSVCPKDEWRMHLWSESLPDDYKYLCKVAYEHWLNMRYVYLKPAPEVISLLRRLQQRYLLALITNGESASQWEKIHNSTIESYFDCILVSGDLPWEKPNPEIFYSACKYLGVEPRLCAIIGDKLESDIQGGKEANLGATIWLPLTVTPYGDRLEPKTKDYVPDVVIRDVLELNELLQVDSVGGGGCDAGGVDLKSRAAVEEARSLSRPFRSLSTGPGAAAKVVTQLDEDEPGHRRGSLNNKARRHFTMSVLADMDSCSSSSSSAEFS